MSAMGAHLRGFTGAGLSDDDNHLVLADDLQELLPHIVHRQQLALFRDGVLRCKGAHLLSREKEKWSDTVCIVRPLCADHSDRQAKPWC